MRHSKDCHLYTNGIQCKNRKKNFIGGSQEHFLHESAIWDRTPPHLHIKCSLYVCGRIHGFQIFKRNSIISICSKVIAFFVISLSPCGPHGPYIVPVIPMLSLSSPLSPEGPHMVPTPPWLWSPLSPPHMVPIPMWSPCCPCGPHIIPIVPTSSLSYPHHPHIIWKVPTSSPNPHIPNPPTPTPLGGGGPESVKMQ